MSQMRFWTTYSDISLKIMIYTFVLSGIKMISPFGITEALSILLRILSLEVAKNSNDYDGARTGDRVVSLGEHPYFDPLSKSRKQDLKGL